MSAHAERVYPEECCGLLLGAIDSTQKTPLKSVVEIVALENKWTPDIIEAERPEHVSKQRRYWIDPVDMLQVQKQARDQKLNIIGIYHSHPDKEAVPSECDRAQAWPDYAYTIVSVHSGKAVDIKNWALDSNHQFQPESMQVAPSSATDRMPVSA